MDEEGFLHESIKERINRDTLNNTPFNDITEPFNIPKIQDVMVSPHLVQVNYYGGHKIPEYNNVPMSAFSTSQSRDQATTDCAGRSVELSEVLDSFREGCMLFIGPPGSGKTTLLKAIARNVIEKKYEGLEDIDVVHHVQCKDLPAREDTTVGELLFPNADDKEDVAEFALKNPKAILFIFDALNELQFPLEHGDGYAEGGIHDRLSPGAVMSNLLKGELIPGSRMIASSRDHSVKQFMGEIQAGIVIKLVGLPVNSVKQVLAGYMGDEKVEELLRGFAEKSFSLSALCSSPLFLACTVIGSQSGANFDPSTMSSIFASVLQSALDTARSRRYDPLNTINKLKKLAFSGVRDSKSFFSLQDLEFHGLSNDEVEGLPLLKQSSSSTLAGNMYRFIHRSFQEFLASSCIAQMALPSFKDVLKSIHSPHYAVVRRFLCGILLDTTVRDTSPLCLGVHENLEEKQTCLTQTMKVQLSQVKEDADRLELFLSIQEAKDTKRNAITSSLRSVDLRDVPLSASDIHAVGSIVHGCKRLNNLWLMRCNLCADALTALETSLKGSDNKISFLYLNGNTNLGIEGASAVGRIAKIFGVTKLSLKKCGFSAKQLRALHDSMEDTQLRWLALNEKRFATTEEIEAVVCLIHNAENELWLGDWEVKDEDIEILQQELNRLNLKGPEIYFSDANKITADLEKGEDFGQEYSEPEDVHPKRPKLSTVWPMSVDDVELPPSAHGDLFIEQEVGSGGGTIRLGACEVKFPAGAVRETTKFKVRRNEAPKLDGYSGITDILTITPSMKFPVPVEVLLPTWCSTNAGEVVAYIMCENDGDEAWQFLDQVPLKGMNGCIKFYTRHFTRFWAVVRRMLFGKLQYSLSAGLYHHPQGNFSVLFHMDSDVLANKCRRELKEHNFQPTPVMLNPIAVKEEDEVKVTLKCQQPPSYVFSPNDPQQFKLNEQFGDEGRQYLSFKLEPLPEPNQLLVLTCQILYNRSIQTKEFNLVWPEAKDAPSSIVVYGDLQAKNLVTGTRGTVTLNQERMEEEEELDDEGEQEDQEEGPVEE